MRTEIDGGEVVAELAAAGAGIAAEDLPRLFAGLGDETPRGQRTGGGAALSLAVAAAIVERHGGRLSAARPAMGSAMGSATGAAVGSEHGVTFTVRLPRAAAAPIAPAPRTEPGAAAGGRPLHILLVEDHPDTAEAMAELLRLDGHRVTVATSVAAARAAADAALADGGGLDLVISDLGLPDGTGHELMRGLAGRGLAAIALSGFGAAEDRDASRDAGFRLHLTKPVDLKTLRQAIRSLSIPP